MVITNDPALSAAMAENEKTDRRFDRVREAPEDARTLIDAHRRAFRGLAKVYILTRTSGTSDARRARSEARRLFIRCAAATLQQQLVGGKVVPTVVVPARAQDALDIFLVDAPEDPLGGVADVLYQCIPPVVTTGNILVGEVVGLHREGVSVHVHGVPVLVPWELAPGFIGTNIPEYGTALFERTKTDLMGRKVFVGMTSGGLRQELTKVHGEKIIGNYAAIGSCRGTRYLGTVLNLVFFPNVVRFGEEQNIWVGASSSLCVVQLGEFTATKMLEGGLTKFLKPHLNINRFAIVLQNDMLSGFKQVEWEARRFVRTMLDEATITAITDTAVHIVVPDDVPLEKVRSATSMFRKVMGKRGVEPVIIRHGQAHSYSETLS